MTTFVPLGTERIILFDLLPKTLIADQSLVEKRSGNGYGIYIVTVGENG